MQRADYEYSASLDASQIEAELSRIDKQMDDLGKRGNGAMEAIGKGSGGAVGGLQQLTGGAGAAEMAIGAIGGVAAMAAMKIVEMAQQGIAQLQALTQQAIQMNSQIETAQVLFGNLMKSEEEAKKFVGELREETQRLGLAFSATTEFAQAIMPDSKNVAEFMELLKTTDRYADFEGVQFERLKLAINEAVAGQMTYIRQWLNLSGAQLDRIKELQKEYGQVAGLTKGMQEILEKKGAGSADSFAGTAMYAEKSLRGMMDNMKLALGDAPFDEYLEGMNRFNKWLNDNSDDLVDLAYSIGEAFAAVMDVTGDLKADALESLDVESLVDMVQEFLNKIVEAADQVHLLIDNVQIWGEALTPVGETINGVFGSFLDGTGAVEKMNTSITNMSASNNAALAGMGNLADAATSSWFPLWGILSHAGEALTTLNQLIALSSAGFAGMLAGLQPVFEDVMGLAELAGSLAAGDYSKAWDIAQRQSNILKGNVFDIDAAMKAASESMQKSLAKMEEADIRKSEREQRRAEREVDLGKSEWENPALAAKDPTLSEDYLKAKDKIDKALEKQRVADERRQEDFDEEVAEKRADAAAWAAENLLKIEEDYQRRKMELRSKYEADVTAENKSYQKELLQMEKRHRSEREEFEKSANERRVELEKEFQKRLKDINEDFQRDAARLAEKRDAIAFVELMRNRDEAVEDAKEQKEEAQTDLDEQIAEEREKLAEQQNEERRQTEEGHAERLAQLRQRLEEELAAAEEKYNADLEKHKETEQQKYDTIEAFIKKRMDAWAKADARRLQDLKTQMEKEIKIIEEAEKKKAALQQSSSGGLGSGTSTKKSSSTQRDFGPNRRNIGGSGTSTKKSSSTPWSQQSSTIKNLNKVVRPTGRAVGGPIYPDNLYVVGEEGPELLRMPMPGWVHPNGDYRDLMYSSPGKGAASNVTYNQQTANLSMLDPTQVSAAQRAQLRQFVLDTLMELEHDPKQ